MVARTEAELGQVTILVNNVGVAWQGTLDTRTGSRSRACASPRLTAKGCSAQVAMVDDPVREICWSDSSLAGILGPCSQNRHRRYRSGGKRIAQTNVPADERIRGVTGSAP